ncbi:MAG: phosphoglycolate phosphatase [Alphaproteobacteria bacterium]|nr:phosphoglycolate phosphatase [Alphaproteobacteria bacterium]
MKFVVFDLDGTLVDSAPDMCAAVNRVLQAAGLGRIDTVQARGFIGDGIDAFVERAWAAAGGRANRSGLREAVDAFVDDYARDPATLSRVYPGVSGTLEALGARGCVLAVCTNKHQAIAERILSRLGLISRFRCVLGGDRVAERKPAPAHLQQVLDEIGADRSDALMVGDSAHDAEMARTAGVRCVLVTYGYGDPEAVPDVPRITRMSDLPAFVSRS